jgi:CBS domain-containing protein
MTARLTGTQFLDQAKEQITGGDEVARTVREFIGFWGAERRGTRVVRRINTELRRKGLVTVPDFNETGIDSTVRFSLRQNGDAPPERGYGLTIEMTTIDIADGLTKAYTLMQLHDFSQLPVLSGGKHLRKTVTWRSLVKALLSEGTKVADALEDATVLRYDKDLLHEASSISHQDYVLVEDETGSISGIVTTADISVLFADQSETFLQLSEIDQRLRDSIVAHFEMSEIESATNDKRVREPDDMSMFHYQKVLTPAENWSKLRWPLDHEVFLDVLDQVRLVRNDVMHFNPDPIEPERLTTVNALVRLLRDNT